MPPTLAPRNTPTNALASPVVRTLIDKPTGAILTYHLTPPPYATMQILDLHVPEPHRRKGTATQLFTRAVDDAKKQLGPSTKLRRVWTLAPQKTTMGFRALLTHLGFHHTATTTGLLKNEDALTYIKSYT